MSAISKALRGRLASISMLLVAVSLVGAIPEAPLVAVRRLESTAVARLVRLLQNADYTRAARTLTYPGYYSVEELAKDSYAVEESLRVLVHVFGRIESATATLERVEFFEVGVGGGPRPFWWQGAGRGETHQFIFAARFAKFGKGFIKILVQREDSVDSPVSIDLGLPTSDPRSEQRIREALNALLDAMDVPVDHPSRSMNLEPWKAPGPR